MENSKIEWTDHTFSPWEGCVKISPACDHCYADTRDKRMHGGSNWGKDASRLMHSDSYWKQPFRWNRQAAASGERKRVFCGSLCDVMEDRQDLHEPRRRLCDVIEPTVYLDWLLLTKRPQNYRRFLPQEWIDYPLGNVWGLTTVEREDFLWRLDALMDTRFVVYGVSMEPLLGPVKLPQRFLDLGKRAWCITGGESGHEARPANTAWYRSLRDQCVEAGVPFHFKQHGEWAPSATANRNIVNAIVGLDGKAKFWVDAADANDANQRGECVVSLVGKKSAGRLLDGVEWNQFPEVA
jgi:protein gp37